MTLTSFETHTGEVVVGDRLTSALAAVADDWAQLGADIYAADEYASHVSQDVKDDNLEKMLIDSVLIRAGEL